MKTAQLLPNARARDIANSLIDTLLTDIPAEQNAHAWFDRTLTMMSASFIIRNQTEVHIWKFLMVLGVRCSRSALKQG